MHKTLIIGDVHGCIDELLELMQQLAPSANDHIIFIGDLIDRGPDSIGVLRQVVQWSKHFHVQLVLGNHEEKFLRYLHHINDSSGFEKEMKGIDKFPDLLSGLNDDELLFLQHAHYSLHLPDLNVLLVHAGVMPRLAIPLPASYRYNMDLSAHQKKTLGLLNKTRYLNSVGEFTVLKQESPEDLFWAEMYDGQWGHIYFGHQPFFQPEPKRFLHATGIDTGCVFGGWLSAVEISNDGVRHIAVPANKIYAIKK